MFAFLTLNDSIVGVSFSYTITSLWSNMDSHIERVVLSPSLLHLLPVAICPIHIAASLAKYYSNQTVADMSPLLNKCCLNLIFCPCLDSYSLLWDDRILTLLVRVGVCIFAVCNLIVTKQTWRFSFMKLPGTVATIGECEIFVTRQCLNWLLPEFHKSGKWLSLHLRHPWMSICLLYNSVLSSIQLRLWLVLEYLTWTMYSRTVYYFQVGQLSVTSGSSLLVRVSQFVS